MSNFIKVECNNGIYHINLDHVVFADSPNKRLEMVGGFYFKPKDQATWDEIVNSITKGNSKPNE